MQPIIALKEGTAEAGFGFQILPFLQLITVTDHFPLATHNGLPLHCLSTVINALRY
ncbi:hypothetical protein [Alkalimarinus coralli]|uniref:hypothetical protein n=1 Tax=Alkalimarinus coralli TaxID=2935863 RepID=UPI00202B1FC2|nr:hypothetical protein [Alkalimarinus coralli]